MKASSFSAHDFVHHIIPHTQPQKPGQGHAPVNIALSKYWGKRNTELNLPTNGSLSISLPELGTDTRLHWIDATETTSDRIQLNGQALSKEQPFAQRLSRFLDYFRPTTAGFFQVDTTNTVPTAAGLASSASGYAALVLALNDAFDWQLDAKALSLLARLGSGSASRSLYSGFAIWHKGEEENGLDSFAEPIEQTWPSLCVGLLEIDTSTKPMGSTQGMQNTVNHCELYRAWPDKAEKDLAVIHQAILAHDFERMGQTAENNALAMHATMIATWPPILYWQAESVAAMHRVWHLRETGVHVYFTMDAGPNLKLLFPETEKPAIKQAFPNVKVLHPFQS